MLSMKLLVAYATTHGSTAEVAEFIGQVFREHHVETTVAPANQVQSVKGYDAFVVGSPVYGGMWLSDISQFLVRFEKELAQKPFYYWMTCIRVLEPDGRDHALTEYIHRPTLDKLGARDVGVFAGKLNLEDIDWKERWTLAARYDGAALPGMRSDDFRDWKAIRQWATQVRNQLLGE
jgi:menaquinone-dependent protoporphyrinogen oxidase